MPDGSSVFQSGENDIEHRYGEFLVYLVILWQISDADVMNRLVVPIILNRSAVNVLQAENGLDQSGLAASVRTDNSQEVFFIYREGHLLQYRFGIVAHLNISQFNDWILFHGSMFWLSESVRGYIHNPAD